MKICQVIDGNLKRNKRKTKQMKINRIHGIRLHIYFSVAVILL